MKIVGMPDMSVGGQDHSQGGDILGIAQTSNLNMVFSYLNHAGVYRQGRANHVDIGCGSGALPLGEAAACRWVGRGVVEGMRGGISMGRAAEVQKLSNILATAAIACLKLALRHCFKMMHTTHI